MSFELTIDCVPYKFDVSGSAATMHSKHFAELLDCKPRFREKYQGFSYSVLSTNGEVRSEGFMFVTAVTDENTVEFQSDDDDISEEDIENVISVWFENELDGILSVGCEVLERNC